MKRFLRTAALAALLPALCAGCSSFGQGPIMSRLHGNRQSECACEGGVGPCCDGPPLSEGVAVGPTLPPTMTPAVPPLAPAPRILTDPAQPTPALPSSRIK